MSILNDVLSKARFVTAEMAPHIHATLNELAQKAEIKNGIELIVCDHKLPVAAFCPTAFVRNAPHSDRQYVIISTGLLNSLGGTLKSPVTPEMETVLAHELSHAKYSGRELAAKTLPLLLLPLAAMLGVHLHEKAKEKQALHPNLNTSEALDAAHAEAQKQVTLNEHSEIPPHVQQSFSEQLLTAAKYLAAAALGLAAGVFIVKQSSIMAEYRADRFASKLTGNGEQLISALDKIRNSALEYMAQHPTKPINPLRKIFIECMQAHPSNLDRAAAIRRL